MEAPAGFSQVEVRAMAAAIKAARHGRRGANPLVGAAVLAANGTLVTGHHRGPDTPHAEPDAIGNARAAGIDLTTATLVVTLEPCRHVGRTPACTQAIINAGIPRVIFGSSDPNPVAAGGARILAENGIDVRTGLLEDQTDALNDRWLAAKRQSRPFVTAKIAQSLDGRIAAADGTSQWITSEEARASVHELRSRVDAVLVGTGTALADDPRLNARASDPAGPVTSTEPAGAHTDRAFTRTGDGTAAVDGRGTAASAHQPIPVVMGMRPLPADSHLARNPSTVHLETRDPHTALAELGGRDIEHVLLEGGARLVSAFLAADLVDELCVHIAPIFLGGRGLATSATLDVPTLTAARRFVPDSPPRQCGPDTIVHVRPG